MLKPPTELLKRVTTKDVCVAVALVDRCRSTGQPVRYAYNILAEMCGVPVRTAKLCLKREMRHGRIKVTQAPLQLPNYTLTEKGKRCIFT